MTHDARRPGLTRTTIRERGHVLAGIALAGAIAATVAGCGSSSSSSGAESFPEFEGTWAIDADASTVVCDDALVNSAFSLWSSMKIEAGVLTDLVETTSVCPFNYDVLKKVATMVTPDPYTGVAPTCTVPLSADGQQQIVLNPRATPAWVFNLLMPVAGTAPKAQVIGQADAAVTIVDNNTGLPVKHSPCTFMANVSLHKIAKP